MKPEHSVSVSALRLISEHVNSLKFPNLTRPPVPHGHPATLELVQWGIKGYGFPWLRHFGKLTSGVITLNDAGNLAAVYVVGRSSYELCAHLYYVNRHLKQHLDSKNVDAAWTFLLPIATGSRYINDRYPESEELFPTGERIGKAVKAFKEVMPKSSDGDDDYSYLSEFCHPNMMAFMQHYRWINPETIEFVEPEICGAFGAITASAIHGLLQMHELLGLANERATRKALHELMGEIAKIAEQERI